MHVIAGLGNPGKEYARHRHNIGFVAVDAIHGAGNFAPWREKFKALVAEGRLAGDKAILIKPMNSMNRSGEAIGPAMRFYKLDCEHLTVIYDELDLPSGRFKVRDGGGNNGHNGLKSIDAHVGKTYRKLRLGIGHPGDKARVNSHVLGNFSRADQDWLDPLVDAIAINARLLVADDPSQFMNKVHGALPKIEKPPTANPAGKGKSHIHQAKKPGKPKAEPTGPLAAMLKKLFGGDD